LDGQPPDGSLRIPGTQAIPAVPVAQALRCAAFEPVQGANKVRSRDQWKGNPDAAPGNTSEPAFVPAEPLRPHLIERPIIIGG